MPGRNDRIPVEVDPFRMAELGRQFEGRLDFSQMPRLLPALASNPGSDDGGVETVLNFGIDDQGIAWLKGSLRTELVLQCQRCLGEMRYPVETEFGLALLRHESEEEKLAGVYEPVIVTTVPIRLAEIVEDEVLLLLPTIARHETNDCNPLMQEEGGEQQEETEPTVNPFAVLADLKKEH